MNVFKDNRKSTQKVLTVAHTQIPEEAQHFSSKSKIQHKAHFGRLLYEGWHDSSRRVQKSFSLMMDLIKMIHRF